MKKPLSEKIYEASYDGEYYGEGDPMNYCVIDAKDVAEAVEELKSETGIMENGWYFDSKIDKIFGSFSNQSQDASSREVKGSSGELNHPDTKNQAKEPKKEVGK